MKIRSNKCNKVQKQKSLTQRARVQVSRDYPWKVLSFLLCDLITAGVVRHEDAALVDQIVRDRDVDAVMLLSEIWGLQSITSSDESLTIDNIRSRRLLAGLLKKFMFTGSEEQRKTKALGSFLEAEASCWHFNRIGWLKLTYGEQLPEVITYARSWIRELLGDRPRWQELCEWARFGPGSTLTTGQGPTSSFFKYSKWPYTVTMDSVVYARFLIETDQRWMGALLESYRIRYKVPMHAPLDMRQFWNNVFEVVDGNRISFVPKSAVTDRTIAIEPLMNLRLQLGVDGLIRRRLKRHDIDLDDQTKNQVLASIGSELKGSSDFTYSTIDLKGASDSVSLKLAELLFPDEWYRFLFDLRAHNGFVPGHGKVSYEKLSSMGNGYTFAIESLIFAALTYAVIVKGSGTVNFKSDFAVFGDDIVVRERYAQELISVLQSCGFTINRDKSFVYGFVKESCGTDWCHGHNVRPVALSNIPSTVNELFVDRNRLARILNVYFGIEDSFVVQKIESWIPPFFMRFQGPVSDTEFSTYLHSPDYKKYGKYEWGRWRYHRLVVRPVKLRVTSWRSFTFRKLMSDLSGRPPSTNPYELGATDGGNCFTITVRNDNVMVSQSYRPAADTWQVQYAGVTTANNFRQSVTQESQRFAERLYGWLGIKNPGIEVRS